MKTHNLKKAPGYQLRFSHNFDTIKIEYITVLGRRISDDKFKELMNSNEEKWVSEILNELKRGKDEYPIR